MTPRTPLGAYSDSDLLAEVAKRGLYEQVGWYKPAETLHGSFTQRDGTINDTYNVKPDIALGEVPLSSLWVPAYIERRIDSADTRSLIANRTPAETAEAKAWSDDAHARIRAGEVSGSHDLMREKVGEYRADAEAT